MCKTTHDEGGESKTAIVHVHTGLKWVFYVIFVAPQRIAFFRSQIVTF